jgi:hypothetical protein
MTLNDDLVRKDICSCCRFFDGDDDGERVGRCKRNAPVPSQPELWVLTKTLSLLFWWYAREQTDAETATKEQREYGIDVDDPTMLEASWPKVEAAEWCGEHQRKTE